ncbi:50S ribosomal protein L35ae [Candidatus Woesearchaeota archaeon]|jgi:large subunit ribosomal protein L35Ae|nr:50S ribosomal protein L35ae [Candidatus Woesearchaeota archaeon]
MEGTISNFKGSHKTQVHNQMIIVVPEVDSRDEAAKLVGKSVVWTSVAGKELKGEVRSAHGNSGAIRVLFETGMPGQSIGQKVKIN